MVTGTGGGHLRENLHALEEGCHVAVHLFTVAIAVTVHQTSEMILFLCLILFWDETKGGTVSKLAVELSAY